MPSGARMCTQAALEPRSWPASAFDRLRLTLLRRFLDQRHAELVEARRHAQHAGEAPALHKRRCAPLRATRISWTFVLILWSTPRIAMCPKP